MIWHIHTCTCLVGRRRTGTHPAQLKGEEIEFRDLTQTPSIEGDKS